MKNLILYDLRKIIKNKIYLLACILVPLLSLFITLVLTFAYSVDSLSSMLGKELLVTTALTTPLTSTNYGITLLFIFLVIMLGRDFGSGTIRNKVVAGYKRTEIFFASYFVTMITSLFVVLIAYLVSLIPAFALIGFDLFQGIDTAAVLLKVFTCLFVLLVSLTLCHVLVYFFKGVGAPLGIMIGLTVGFNSLAVILNLILGLVSMSSANPDRIKIVQEILSILPFYQTTLTFNLGTPTEQPVLDFGRFILYDIVHIAGLIALGWTGFRKTDIK
jgi:ABC-type transport system involved in multi-copper enzyme maturation permease subunit